MIEILLAETQQMQEIKKVVIDNIDQTDIESIMKIIENCAPYLELRDRGLYWTIVTFFRDTCLIARINGKAVGFIMAFVSQVNPKELYVQDIGILPEYRKKGIGMKLMEKITQIAVMRNCNSIVLTTKPGNGAVTFWKKLGFKNVSNGPVIDGEPTILNLKGAGNHRILFRKDLTRD